jgi:hypothetical protein
MNLICTQPPPITCYLVPLMPNRLPQDHILEQSQFMSFHKLTRIYISYLIYKTVCELSVKTAGFCNKIVSFCRIITELPPELIDILVIPKIFVSQYKFISVQQVKSILTIRYISSVSPNTMQPMQMRAPLKLSSKNARNGL